MKRMTLAMVLVGFAAGASCGSRPERVSIQGRVAEATGRPGAALVVTLVWRGEGDQESVEVSTDAQGVFRASGLVVGTYDVTVSLPFDQGRLHQNDAELSLGGFSGSSWRVHVNGRDELKLSIETMGELGGVVQAAKDRPAVGMTVAVRRHSYLHVLMPGPIASDDNCSIHYFLEEEKVAPVTTDASGRFLVPNLRRGTRYRLAVRDRHGVELAFLEHVTAPATTLVIGLNAE